VIGPLLLDPQGGRVEVGGVPVHLSQTDYLLLTELARNQGRPVPWPALLRRVWRVEPAGAESRTRVALSRLRARLKALAGESLIETVRGEGYRLRQPERGPAHQRSA
jgi:two-component system OmpR family response regulator